ncbi:MAG: MCE family protein [Deltaproteobacteria bacterium]|nr:MCE family protein [Deltaproteobacteria bacterium]
MAKQANRMMIGVFVVIAVIIMAASLVVFGSGKFFKKTNKYILYFDESVKGLSVGAPVLFQGVQVGSVVSIVIQTDLEKMKTYIPIIIEVEPEKFNVDEEDRKKLGATKPVTKLIEKGLRAVLAMQSLITGQLVIELDFFPDSPLCYPPPRIDKDYIVIPTCQSTSQRLANALEKLDLEGLKKNLESTLAGVDRFVNNPDLAAGIRALKDTLQDASKLVTRVERQVDPLADDLKKTVKDIGKLARDTDAKVAGLTTSLDKTMSAARGVISEDAPLIVELQNTLKEISAMGRIFRQFADYLEQHPEVLIRGKGKPGGKEQ